MAGPTIAIPRTWPPRVSVNGGAVTLQGMGFAPGMSATVGSSSATPLAITSTGMTLAVPPRAEGPQSITVRDAVSGASTMMTGALTYGAAVSDSIVLLNGGNPSTPVGVQAVNPMSVRVVASDGTTLVSGATVGWSGTNGLLLSACGGASSCTVITDQNGNAATWLTASAPGASYITATLAPGVSSPSKSVTGTLSATRSSLDIGVPASSVYVSQGATFTLPISARVMSNGNPKSNVQVNFSIVGGSGNLSAASAVTDTNGYASVTLSATNITVAVQGVACVSPGNSPCAVFDAYPVPLAQQVVQQISGGGQISTGALQPVVVRVVDLASSPHPVVAAPVIFLTTVMRPGGVVPTRGGRDPSTGNPAMPVILSVTQSNTLTDASGVASVTPSSAGFSAPVEVDITATAGTSVLNDSLFVLPAPALVGGSGGSAISAKHPLAVPVEAERFVRSGPVMQRTTVR